MSYYHKYRPSTFSEMLGNDAQLESLGTNLAKENPPHAIMISGPSGCGKTTMARAAAKQILRADDLTIHEVNTAENRGIDTARDIIERMRYGSPSGQPVVFIIDECHKTTADWQNAMLKPLEDTPSHVFFFLCTTDPQKLIRAIHTRCFKVEVQTLQSTDLYRLLRRVAKAEQLAVPNDILAEISENSGGSPREALNKLEAVSSMTDTEKMLAVISTSTEESAATIDLCRILLKAQNWGAVGKVLAALKDAEPESVRRAVMGYMQAILLKQDNPRAAACSECFAEPTYNTGFPGITLACYQAIQG